MLPHAILYFWNILHDAKSHLLYIAYTILEIIIYNH